MRAFNYGKMLFAACSYAVPAYAVGDGIYAGHDSLWLSILLALICVTLAVAYTGARRRIQMLKLAVTRMEAKADALVTYTVKPENDNGVDS